jgi:hypothetical protein
MRWAAESSFFLLVRCTISVKPNVSLIGAGWGASAIVTESSFPGDVLLFQQLKAAVLLKGLTIKTDNGSQRSAMTAAAIHIRASDYVCIEDTQIANQYVCCQIDDLDGTGCHNIFIDRGYWGAISNDGAGLRVNTIGNDIFVSNLVMYCNATTPRAGVQLTSCQAFWMRDCDVMGSAPHGHRSGLLVDTPNSAGRLVTHAVFSECDFDGCPNFGIELAPTSGAIVKNLEFNGCWTGSTGAYDGIVVSGPVDGCNFIGHRSIDNRGNGLNVASNSGATNIMVDSSVFSGNRSNGVALGDIGYCAIRNCVIGQYAGASGNSGYGVVTSNTHHFILVGNFWSQNTKGAWLNSGGITYEDGLNL